MSVQALKESIAKLLGIPGLTGSRLRMRTGASLNFAMKDACNLAFYNVPDQGTLLAVLKK